MNRPTISKLLNRNNRVISEILSEFKGKSGKILDIGCGCGDVTIECVLPILSSKFERLIGVDISENMINHARQKYSLPKIEFKQFDIAEDDCKHLPRFDHIVSFNCFNWIENQRAALQNIYNILKPGGDCLLMFSINASIFDAYEQMSRDPNWSKYLEKVNTPYQMPKNSKAEFERLLNESKFSSYRVDVRFKEIEYDDINNIKNFVKAIDLLKTIHERLPAEEHDAYFNELTKLSLDSVDATVKEEYSNENLALIPYSNRILVAYGKK